MNALMPHTALPTGQSRAMCGNPTELAIHTFYTFVPRRARSMDKFRAAPKKHVSRTSIARSKCHVITGDNI